MPSEKYPEPFQQHDIDFYQRELASFIPDRVIDTHSHLWRVRHYPGKQPPGFPDDLTWADYQRLVEPLFPDRTVGGWVLPKPVLRDEDKDALPASEWVGEQLKGQKYARGAFLIRPGDDPEWVRENTKRLGLIGFKCYHTLAVKKPTYEAEIPEYLPEPIVKVADEEGWIITLHMVKSRAVADPGNLHWIKTYLKKYPNMKLILAHSARGFQPAHNFEGLPELTGYDNLYFDASANCEPMAHESILRIIGHKRLMNGIDFGAASHSRGRSVAAADTFIWLYGDTPVWDPYYVKVTPVLIALEYLRSLKWACWAARLTDSQIEDVFWNNAAELLGIE